MLPPSFVGIKYFNTRNFLKHSRVHLRTDSVLWDKTILTENRETHPSLIPNIFRYPKPFETQKGSSTKRFGTVIENNFDGKSWKPPPLLSLTIFDTRNFLKHRRAPLRNDSVDKTILVENRNTRPLSYPFRYPKPFETQKGSSTKWFGRQNRTFFDTRN